MADNKIDISVIIPIFNEAGKIRCDIEQAAAFFVKNGFSGEIIVVDDGSLDGCSRIAQQAFDDLGSSIKGKVISYSPNKGKGYAVKTGILNSTGRYTAFIDSGNCIRYDAILAGIDLIGQNKCDIAHASRNLTSSRILRQKSLYRRLCSAAFQFLIKLYLPIPKELTDTQCGLKIYNGNIARKLYADASADGFMFDIEIIVKAVKANCRIKEFPVDWTCDADSRLSPAKSFFRLLKELHNIKHRLC